MPIFAHSAIEGVTLGSTRVIYKSTDEMSVVKATNFSEKNYWLLRSWVSNYFDDQKNECFIVTPPLHRIEPNDEIQLQIKAIREEKIPDDRESLFRLNVLAIPPKTFLSTDGKEIKGHLQFAINSRIKLIYRPARIGEPYDIPKKLYVHKFNDLVTIKNPTPFFVTLVNISIDGKTIHRDIDEVIKPYSEINIDARNPKWIEFSTVNDKGGTTPPIKINL
ncbi:TPA: molecular chaperone [Escherichia coli]|nr:molecular chaperone [Escherichia coli]HAY2851332.1 molecular chaperone [Escherichia coli]HAY3364980.1 molecular chaperone [Escherichia coli]HAZ7311628.1 molecular chaperone [Escherichia coli]HBH8670464.1 molecular chaperone [Escherichia coli]